MKCPFCSNLESRVIDSRPAEEGATIRRRRECLNCQKRFTTYEIVERIPIVVSKKDGSREQFDKQKLISGMLRACANRPIALAKLQEVTDDIEMELQNSLENEISSALVGELVMRHLKRLDEVAYVRFASVYRHFTDTSDFMTELNRLIKSDNGDNAEG
ncbi:MAG: transcriptional regulator NrdR [Oscillospiraceae bacterium]|jgi:transcriptional repressor NrdR|nr:transcriptional regulator NrdR [Oscillospiraceae bacterium]